MAKKTAKKQSPIVLISARAKELKKTDSKTKWAMLIKKASAQLKKEGKI